jgi:DNA (cytosine-5)-methyltransferase 1
MSRASSFSYYEFFAGGGMAHAGLGDPWRCDFANDFSQIKATTYKLNWPSTPFHGGDIYDIRLSDLPNQADLAWASSPCQDLSLAGSRRGLGGGRSSAFWGFWRLIEGLNREGRAPNIIVVENVVGLLSSHGGHDFTSLCAAFSREGYRFGAIELDAATFLPQSRPRVFVVATRLTVPARLEGHRDLAPSKKVREAFARIPEPLCREWIWWSLPPPPIRNHALSIILEPDDVVAWHTPEQTARLIDLMGPVHRSKLAAAKSTGSRQVGTIFRRMRVEAGVKTQRAEARYDGLAGCLRTPGGGSSRQSLIVVEGESVRTRALTSREGARLMGLSENYQLPARQGAAFQVLGDGVAVPVVEWLARTLLQPLMDGAKWREQRRAKVAD